MGEENDMKTLNDLFKEVYTDKAANMIPHRTPYIRIPKVKRAEDPKSKKVKKQIKDWLKENE